MSNISCTKSATNLALVGVWGKSITPKFIWLNRYTANYRLRCLFCQHPPHRPILPLADAVFWSPFVSLSERIRNRPLSQAGCWQPVVPAPFSPRRYTPHPALRATFSSKEKAYIIGPHDKDFSLLRIGIISIRLRLLFDIPKHISGQIIPKHFFGQIIV